jgi:hypothetical protein
MAAAAANAPAAGAGNAAGASPAGAASTTNAPSPVDPQTQVCLCIPSFILCIACHHSYTPAIIDTPQCEITTFHAVDVRTLLLLLRSPEPTVTITAVENLGRFADICKLFGCILGLQIG